MFHPLLFIDLFAPCASLRDLALIAVLSRIGAAICRLDHRLGQVSGARFGLHFLACPLDASNFSPPLPAPL
jgi:hypothetical protein